MRAYACCIGSLILTFAAVAISIHFATVPALVVGLVLCCVATALTWEPWDGGR